LSLLCFLVRTELEIILRTKYLNRESERRKRKLWDRKGLVLGALEELVGPNLAMNFVKQGAIRIGKQKSKFIRGPPRWLGTETVVL